MANTKPAVPTDIKIILPRLRRGYPLTPAEVRVRALTSALSGNHTLAKILEWAAEACPELVIPIEDVPYQAPEGVGRDEAWGGNDQEVMNLYKGGTAVLGIVDNFYNSKVISYTGLTTSKNTEIWNPRYWLAAATLEDWKSIITQWKRT